MNKLAKLFIMGIIVLITFTACDDNTIENENEDPNPPSLATVVDIEFTIPDSTGLSNYISEEIDYNGAMVTAYVVDQFVDIDFVNAYIDEDGFDGRELFAVEIVSSDVDGNFSPRIQGYYDLSWDDFITGFLLPTEMGRIYFPDDNIPTGYNVRWATYLRLYRKFDVVLDANVIIFETGAFETLDVYHQAGNGNFYTDPGFALTGLVSDYVTENPENYEYNFTSPDDETAVFTWEDIQSAYWLTTQNKAVFLNEDGTEFYSSFKYLSRIELVEIQ